MLAILHSLGMFIVDLFKSRGRLEAENLFLRHQLSIALAGLQFCSDAARPTRLGYASSIDQSLQATAPARRRTSCVRLCHRKGVSNVHCTAIPSQSSRIQGIPHPHTAFAEGNEGIPRSRADLHDACRKRGMVGSSSR